MESPDDLRASWLGLSRLSTWFGALNVRERDKGLLPAWVTGSSPAMTTRAETDSYRYKNCELRAANYLDKNQKYT